MRILCDSGTRWVAEITSIGSYIAFLFRISRPGWLGIIFRFVAGSEKYRAVRILNGHCWVHSVKLIDLPRNTIGQSYIKIRGKISTVGTGRYEILVGRNHIKTI